MESLYARTVFFVRNAEEALRFYTETLGFTLDWNHEYEGRPCVFQVSLLGFELILNQAHGPTENHAGHGRAFIGLEDHQADSLLAHLRRHSIAHQTTEWGRPTLVLRDPDGNELFFWLPDSAWAQLP